VQHLRRAYRDIAGDRNPIIHNNILLHRHRFIGRNIRLLFRRHHNRLPGDLGNNNLTSHAVKRCRSGRNRIEHHDNLRRQQPVIDLPVVLIHFNIMPIIRNLDRIIEYIHTIDQHCGNLLLLRQGL
jgi:hypothetical protein